MKIMRHAAQHDRPRSGLSDGLNFVVFVALALLGWVVVALGIIAIYKGAGLLLG